MVSGNDNSIRPAFSDGIFNKCPALLMFLVKAFPSQWIFAVPYKVEVAHITLSNISVSGGISDHKVDVIKSVVSFR